MKSYTNSSHKQKFSKTSNSNKSRNVSIGIKLKIIFSNVQFFIGFIFLIVGLSCMFIFALLVDFSDLKFSKNDPIAKGTITGSQYTNSTVNDRTVIEYSYQFVANDGKEYFGSSYSTYNYVDQVEIVYLKDDPNISKITGTTRGSLPLWVILFVLIFPVIGFFLAFGGLKKSLNWINIVKYGKISFGTFLRDEATGASVNDQPVMRLFFKFSLDGNEYEAVGETYKTYKLIDETFEPLIYNPDNPHQAIMVDSLPNSVRKLIDSEIAQQKVINKNPDLI